MAFSLQSSYCIVPMSFPVCDHIKQLCKILTLGEDM